VLHGSNKVAFDALVENRDEGAVEANRRAANAVESDVDGGDDDCATEDESTDNEDRNSAVAKQHSGRGSRKGQRGPPGGRMGLYAAAISKAKSPAEAPQRSTKGKGNAKAQENRAVDSLPASRERDSRRQPRQSVADPHAGGLLGRDAVFLRQSLRQQHAALCGTHGY